EGVVVLKRARAEGDRVADAAPRLRRSRRSEAAAVGGRPAVGDTFEDRHAVLGDAANFAGAGFGDYVIHFQSPPASSGLVAGWCLRIAGSVAAFRAWRRRRKSSRNARIRDSSPRSEGK